jgi:ferredoxin/flavodoxin---NADP+ reductase
MSAFNTEKILSVHHWNDTLFSFTCTRDPALRFHNGHFVMIGLPVNGKPLLRAYSIASPNHSEHLEFLSIKVQDGPLTSRLQHLKVGDELIVSKKPVGTLVIDDLKPAKNLYLLGTGTGLAPFISIIQDPATYERFEKVIVVHGVRLVSELAYADFIQNLHKDELLGELIGDKLLYYPTVTREPFRNQGRLTEGFSKDGQIAGKIESSLGLPALNPVTDRVMVCGSPAMLADTCAMVDALGFVASKHTGDVADYVIERAFVEK